MNFKEYNQVQGPFILIIFSKAIEGDHPAPIIIDIIKEREMKATRRIIRR